MSRLNTEIAHNSNSTVNPILIQHTTQAIRRYELLIKSQLRPIPEQRVEEIETITTAMLTANTTKELHDTVSDVSQNVKTRHRFFRCKSLRSNFKKILEQDVLYAPGHHLVDLQQADIERLRVQQQEATQTQDAISLAMRLLQQERENRDLKIQLDTAHHHLTLMEALLKKEKENNEFLSHTNQELRLLNAALEDELSGSMPLPSAPPSQGKRLSLF